MKRPNLSLKDSLDLDFSLDREDGVYGLMLSIDWWWRGVLVEGCRERLSGTTYIIFLSGMDCLTCEFLLNGCTSDLGLEGVTDVLR